MSQPTVPQTQPRPKKPSALPSNRPAPHPTAEARAFASGDESSREEDAEPIDDADVIETEDAEPQAPETD